MKMKKKSGIWILVTCVVLLLLVGCKKEPVFTVEESTDSLNRDSHPEEQVEEDNAEQQKEDVEIYVQVSGAVVSPGVYQLPLGSRVFQAVEMAGGLREDADFASVNQAKILTDGEQIYIYAVGEERELQSKSPQDDGKVNLNTATAEDLMNLPGIGRSKADSIIAFREENGGFSSIEELMNIPGIKEGVFSKIKDHIKIS